SSNIVMQSPEGQEFPNPGVYLEVIPNRKLVFTDAYTKAWEPSAKPPVREGLIIVRKNAAPNLSRTVRLLGDDQGLLLAAGCSCGSSAPRSSNTTQLPSQCAPPHSSKYLRMPPCN